MDSFRFGGTDFAAYGVTVTYHPGQSLPDPKLDMQDRGGGHGGVAQSSYLGARRFTWDCMLTAPDEDTLWSRLRTVRSLLSPTLGDQWLSADHIPDTQVLARLNGPINEIRQGFWAVSFQLNWLCADPFEYSQVEYGQSGVSIAADPTTVYEPASASAVVDGTWAPAPVWTVVNTHATPVSGVTLTNVTTGEAMSWVGTLAQNDRLRIDCAREHVEKSTDGGSSWVSAMGGIGTADQFPALQPGVRNTITVAGVATGTLDVSYRARWA